MPSSIGGSSIDSSNLMTGESSDMGRYDFATSADLSGFKMGNSLATFHIAGSSRVAIASDMLNRVDSAIRFHIFYDSPLKCSIGSF